MVAVLIMTRLDCLFWIKWKKKKGGGSDFPVNMKSQGPWCQTEVKATSVTTLLWKYHWLIIFFSLVF